MTHSLVEPSFHPDSGFGTTEPGSSETEPQGVHETPSAPEPSPGERLRSTREPAENGGGDSVPAASGGDRVPAAPPLPPPEPVSDVAILGNIDSDFPHRMVPQADGTFRPIAKPKCLHADAWKNLKEGKTRRD